MKAKKRIIKVKSSRDARKKYTVTITGNKRSCSCPAWIFHYPRKDCKHIKAVA